MYSIVIQSEDQLKQLVALLDAAVKALGIVSVRAAAELTDAVDAAVAEKKARDSAPKEAPDTDNIPLTSKAE